MSSTASTIIQVATSRHLHHRYRFREMFMTSLYIFSQVSESKATPMESSLDRYMIHANHQPSSHIHERYVNFEFL